MLRHRRHPVRAALLAALALALAGCGIKGPLVPAPKPDAAAADAAKPASGEKRNEPKL
jgi:predicted small lipoprotein YifL